MLFCLFLGFIAINGVFSTDSHHIFHHSIVLHEKTNFIVSWAIGESDIEFEIEAATHGFLSIGFSPSGGMAGADIIVGGVTDSGVPYLSDRYSSSNALPVEDSIQNVELIHSRKNETHTSLKFRRSLDTCDHDQDMEITNSTTRLLYAWGDEPFKLDENQPNIKYHEGRRGKKLVYFMGRYEFVKPSSPDVRSWDLMAPTIEIHKDKSTLYWCKIHKIPKFEKKQHVIAYEPVLTDKNRDILHHMTLFECNLKRKSDYLEKWADHSGVQCHTPNMPDSFGFCATILATWDVGSDGFVLPSHVGYPFTEGEENDIYIMSEMHYDNVAGLEGSVEPAGIRLYYTDQLREHDAGILALGHQVHGLHTIPPNKPDWISVSHCPGECTQKAFPRGGINVIGVFLHAHLLGSKLSLRLIRDKQELPVVAEDRTFDFNYQVMRYLPQERKVLPGDHLITTCHYNSKIRKRTTYGGLESNNEMCRSFLLYYPRMDFSDTHSRPPATKFVEALGITLSDDRKLKLGFSRGITEDIIKPEKEDKLILKDLESMVGKNSITYNWTEQYDKFAVVDPAKYRRKSLLTVLNDNSIWEDEEISNRVQDLFQFGEYEAACYDYLRKQIDVKRTYFAYPEFTPLPERASKCSSSSVSEDTSYFSQLTSYWNSFLNYVF